MTNSVTNTAGSSASAPSATAAAAKQANITQDAFLQLLVAQIKNQNPLNPTDGTQFLTQLAQFSELEQIIGMRSDMSTLATELKPPTQTTDNNTGTDNKTGVDNV